MATVNEEKLREEVQEKFGETLEDRLVAECVHVCQIFNLTGEELFWKWEAMSFGTSGPKQFTADVLPALKAKCQSDLARASTKRQQAFANLNRHIPLKTGTGIGRPGLQTPGRTPVKPPPRRQDGFGVAQAEETRVPVAGPSRVKFEGPSTNAEARNGRAYRYMYEKVYDRSTALDKRIDDLGELVREHYQIEDLGDPSAATEDEIVVVGRITHDSETSAGSKLNEASLTLETSRQLGSGARVPLRFDPQVKLRQGKQHVGGIGLFSGAIVALKGKNGGGGWFLVTEVLALPPLKAGVRDCVKSENPESSLFSMHVACGPFTPDADLQYAPWKKLVAKITEDKPAVVLLIGPFIDASHPAVQNGEVDATPAEMFRELFLENMRDFLSSSPSSIVLIVPSVRDIISDHAVFPQSELSAEFSNDPRIYLLPNPCRFTLNGLAFGVSSIDVLYHLRKEELFKRTQEAEPVPLQNDEQAGDAMANLCRHLLQQRSFYPIFPVPLDLAHEINLDVSHSTALDIGGEGDEAECAPDVLVTPSRLKHFTKMVDATLTINPSFLTKATYATLTCAGGGSNIPLKDRVKAEVLRLE